MPTWAYLCKLTENVSAGMFTLADKHPFAADAKKCSLWAGHGYSEDSFSWELCLHSKSKRLRLGDETDEGSFGICLHPQLGPRDWRHLNESRVELSPELLACSFYFNFGCYGQWEDLLSLDLRFGEARDGKVEVWAGGSGAVEAAPNLFPEGKVEFQIHTLATFRGVAINIPLNVTDPIPYSEAKIKSLLPRYAFAPPVLRKTNDDTGVLRAVEVLFAPDISRN